MEKRILDSCDGPHTRTRGETTAQKGCANEQFKRQVITNNMCNNGDSWTSPSRRPTEVMNRT